MGGWKRRKILLMGVISAEVGLGTQSEREPRFLVNLFILWSQTPPFIRIIIIINYILYD